MTQARRGARAPLALDLTIPGDELFVGTVRALSVRVAEFVGYSGPEAAAIGDAVGDAVSNLVAQGRSDGCVEVHFSTDRRRMTIDLHRARNHEEAARRRVPVVRLTRPLPPDPPG